MEKTQKNPQNVGVIEVMGLWAISPTLFFLYFLKILFQFYKTYLTFIVEKLTIFFTVPLNLHYSRLIFFCLYDLILILNFLFPYFVVYHIVPMLMAPRIELNESEYIYRVPFSFPLFYKYTLFFFTACWNLPSLGDSTA